MAAPTEPRRRGVSVRPMRGLLEVDGTEARRRLAAHDPPWSTTAYVVAAVARAAAVHRAVNVDRDWRGRLAQHRHVGVQTLVEVPTREGPFGLVHVVRDADVRGIADITAELRAVKRDPSSTASGLLALMLAVIGRPVRVHRRTGTVQMTAVGMFAGGGLAIAPPTLDHGVVDGAPASRFGADLGRLLEDPAAVGLTQR